MVPATTSTGIQIMSANLLLDDERDPVIWRGPVIAGAVKQFWSETLWKDIDFMFVDMPPGTGDVPLTVFQSLPVDGIIIVTSPQELVSMIVGGEHGQEDGDPHFGRGGKYELSAVSGLREKDPCVRGEPY
jgi:Mrp family chromosome partitioning ATPase